MTETTTLTATAREVSPAIIAGASAPSQEAMSHAPFPSLSHRMIHLAGLHTGGRIWFAARIARFATQSALYAADPALKAAVDMVIQAGATLEAASQENEAKKKAFVASLVARDIAQQRFDASAAALKAAAQEAGPSARGPLTAARRPRRPRSSPRAGG